MSSTDKNPRGWPVSETAGGTTVYEPTAEQYQELLERECETKTGWNLVEFCEAYRLGILDTAGDADVSELAALVRASGRLDS